MPEVTCSGVGSDGRVECDEDALEVVARGGRGREVRACCEVWVSGRRPRKRVRGAASGIVDGRDSTLREREAKASELCENCRHDYDIVCRHALLGIGEELGFGRDL